ncbi:unnamed protein product [Arctia plantaginis]|uniref:Lipase domain-containing protein n=1 Tax=Arctia plantaginis TaxID=874455 RepID=A0A8S1ASN8_ARCPL|nr:unnamed protein product [Arctia plantaginis]CAB3247863.1 unnamed protein product [Arctia plantaginis]
MFTCVYTFLFIVGTVFGDDENQAKLRYYYNSFEDYTELPFDRATEIFSKTWYNSSRTTTIFCHGFTGHPEGPAITAIMKAYLEQGQSNVVLLNWDRLAASIFNAIPQSYLNWAVPNSIKLGVDFAEILMKLSDAGLDLNKTHLVGHSLGAHIMGMAGNLIAKKGVLLPWITGLDPAGIGFDSKFPEEKLSPKSARFVDIIHSDPNKYGTIRSLGTVDFWPNYRSVGRVIQPGCVPRISTPFSPEDLCNHNRSWELYLDAMKQPETIIGSHAKSFRVWKKYNKKQRAEKVLEIGKFEPNAVPGNYYLLTSAKSPFGLGENGL